MIIRLWLLAGAIGATLAAATPETHRANKQAIFDGRMLHVVVRDIDLELDDGSYFPSARYLWICPGRGIRIEVPDNVQKGLNDLIIIGKGNSWTVSTAKGTGEHVSTNDTMPETRMRLFGPLEPRTINQLSFGSELEFFQEVGAGKSQPQRIDSIVCDVYEIRVDSTHLTLYVRQSTGCPYQISIRSPYKHFSIRYDVYERWLPCDSSLFAPPSGVRWQEAKQP